MKRYDSYKDSGIKWVGEIPAHWEAIRLSKLCSTLNGLWTGKKQPFVNVGVIRNANFTKDFKLDYSNIEYIDVEEESFKKRNLRNGDLIVEKSGGGEKTPVGRTVLYEGEDGKFSFSNFTMILRLKDETLVMPIFLYYYLLRLYIQGYLNTLQIHTTGLRNLIVNKFISTIVYFPPLPEQQVIADYLQDKTQKIDQYIADRQQQIELLAQLKQSEIANVVTKGLNPDVPMKDSGIPWIGEIPAHWEVRMLSQVSKEHYISNKNVHHQNLLSLSYGRIINKDINKTDGLLPVSFDTYQIIEDGNIVLRLTDLQNDHKSLRVGLCTQEGIITSAYLALVVSKDILPKYLYYYLHTTDIMKVFYSMGGGLRQNLNWSELRKLNVILPPLSEQQAIVDYIDARLAKIDQCIADLTAEIEYIKEFKQRLISDAVTGQIKVID